MLLQADGVRSGPRMTHRAVLRSGCNTTAVLYGICLFHVWALLVGFRTYTPALQASILPATV
jgi:hypothetical protein